MNGSVVNLNCVGLQCPAPILAISKAAKAAPRPTRLEVTADDGDFAVDVRAWCRSTGAVLESLQEVDGTFVARIALQPEHRTSEPAPSRPPTTPSPAPAAQRGAAQVEVDCRGMQCPAPILHITRAARAAVGPTVLMVFADDDDFPPDLDAWCRSTGAVLIDLQSANGQYAARVGLNGAGSLVSAKIPPSGGPSNRAEPSTEVDLRGQPSELALLTLGRRVLEGELVRFLADQGPIERQIVAWAAAIGATADLSRNGAEVRGSVRLVSGAPQLQPVRPHLAPAPAPDAFTASLPEPSARSFGAQFPLATATFGEPTAVPRKNKATFLVLRNDFESLMAAMMVATGSAAQGMEVEMFFSFWGVNVLRTPFPRRSEAKSSNPLKKMMKWMMPAGPEAQTMSKMHFGGAGLGMMKMFMKEQQVMTLAQLMRQAVDSDVKFVVCTMSMGIMGIEKSDLMDLPNISFGGVASFTASARESALSMVF